MTQTPTDVTSSRAVAVDALLDFESGAEFADEILSNHLNASGLRGSDRAFTADLYWGVIRWRGRLDGCVIPTFHGDYQRANVLIRVLLRLGTYQLFVQDKVPDHAAVSQTVEIAVSRLGKSAAGLINAILRRLARERERWDSPPAGTDEVGRLAFFHSHPRWIVRSLLDQFGQESAELALVKNNTRPALVVAVDTTKQTVPEFESRLRERGVKWAVSEFRPNYLRLGTPALHLIQPFLDSGLITVQDESAGMAVALLDPQPGEHVLDMCAAPGGKAIAIWQAMEGRGRLTAVEVSDERAGQLRQNLARVEANNVEVVVADARTFPVSTFDRVLVDAPCSAMGLLRRQPDVRWRRKNHHLPAHQKLQIELLTRAGELVKKGGVIVYSTCSILNSENHDIVSAFMREYPEFQKEDARGLLPESVIGKFGDMETFTHIHDTDGAYAARLRRVGHS